MASPTPEQAPQSGAQDTSQNDIIQQLLLAQMMGDEGRNAGAGNATPPVVSDSSNDRDSDIPSRLPEAGAGVAGNSSPQQEVHSTHAEGSSTMPSRREGASASTGQTAQQPSPQDDGPATIGPADQQSLRSYLDGELEPAYGEV